MSRVRLTALRVRGVLARALARTAMRLVPPAPLALVAGLPDTEENSLVTALALARRFRGRIVLVAREPAAARAALARTARVLGVDHVDRVEVRAKRDPTTPWLFVRATWVAYTHGLFDSPRPVGRRVHVNLWHGTGPKWNANANQSVRIGADVLAAAGPVWGAEVVRALCQPRGTVVVPGNPRQDVVVGARDRTRLAALGLDPDRPLVLWLPTFRRSATAGRTGLSEGVPLTQDPLARRLARVAAEHGVQLVLKAHRHDDDDLGALGVRVLTEEEIAAAGTTLHELMGLADGVVSDYSSAWVDFLVTGRSVALLCPDLDRYEAERGLNRPGLREVAGELLLDEPGAHELFATVAGGEVFRATHLAEVRSRLGIGERGGSRAAALLDALARLAGERHGSSLGLAATSS